jgi:hypothetical protein
MNDMDAFTELVKRSPDMELMKIEELHGIVFWAGAATKWANLQIELAQSVGGMHEQIAAWRRDGQAAAELDFKATQRLGVIAQREPQAQGSGAGGNTSRTISPVKDGAAKSKWERLGFKSRGAMNEAEMLANYPKEAQQVIEEAKKADDFPSRGAVKNKVRANKMEERAKKAEEIVKRRQNEADEKTSKQQPKFVKEFFDGTAVYTELLRVTLIGAERGGFDPSAINFVTKKLNKVREMMKTLEGLI